MNQGRSKRASEKSKKISDNRIMCIILMFCFLGGFLLFFFYSIALMVEKRKGQYLVNGKNDFKITMTL